MSPVTTALRPELLDHKTQTGIIAAVAAVLLLDTHLIVAVLLAFPCFVDSLWKEGISTFEVYLIQEIGNTLYR